MLSSRTEFLGAYSYYETAAGSIKRQGVQCLSEPVIFGRIGRAGLLFVVNGSSTNRARNASFSLEPFS
ncbi:hypothetical protein H6F86_29395 [Phormidium sp. FACHB-592]|uniref:Uncharacterized protein n=1 Tax=Stenomitos frigidus AS-A4 TaxID=2933935 RepID=A0ABV0KR32_9CYAN|nr:hypothetical protein [Phormidium sp. FACHB-592]MBD2077929.1 hypothetical protein [Phormidium sp. FACHB-592]